MQVKRLPQLSTISILFFTLGLLCTNSKILALETDDTNRCSAITLENAATILVVSPNDLQKNRHDVMVSPDDIQKKIYNRTPYICTIRSKSNFLKFITYVTYVYNDTGQARIEFNKMQKGFESISKVDLIPDIGNETFWAGDNRFQRMVSIKGNVVIDVLSPKDFKLQTQVIRLLWENF
ncbi:MAG: hypothetical protein KJ990_08115 [Proteobacteria bacterium]|nr:hypothetical protein [Pseudomonadota bacterium]MBU1649056.1 hypothetical protein [Pseudomonadota bacterium]MBU1986792.1 hypothetical protein [Pseudomonadota bacterium]